MKFEAEVSHEVGVSITVFAWDGDGRTNGVLLRLNEEQFFELKDVVRKADELFAASRQSRLAVLVRDWGVFFNRLD